jgi:uncharacterized coiled-coil protein SlyX
MKWDRASAIVAISALLLTVCGYVYARGALDARLQEVEVKASEFKASEKVVVELSVRVSEMGKSLDEVRSDVKTILSRMPEGAK